MQAKHLFLAIALLLLAVGVYTAPDTATVEAPQDNISVVVADTPEEWRKGLMNYDQVPLDGMLFSYPEARGLTFWMKDTSIPLDIVFLDRNGTVLNVAQADPEPGTPIEELTRYHSAGPALYALEIRQGRADELGLSEGASVDIRQ